jgi:hypothetical protein
MELNKRQFETMILRQGFVFIEVQELIKEQTDSGIMIKAFADDTKSSFYARKGKVVRFHHETDYPPFNFFYDSNLDIEVGDEVWWSANVISHLINTDNTEPKVFKYDGKSYVLVPYKSLTMRKRGSEYVGLNDFAICRPIKREVKSSFDLSMTEMAKPLRRVLEVVYAPLEGVKYKFGGRAVKVREGDKVFLRNDGQMINELESAYVKSMDDVLYTVQTENILAVE